MPDVEFQQDISEDTAELSLDDCLKGSLKVLDQRIRSILDEQNEEEEQLQDEVQAYEHLMKKMKHSLQRNFRIYAMRMCVAVEDKFKLQIVSESPKTPEANTYYLIQPKRNDEKSTWQLRLSNQQKELSEVNTDKISYLTPLLASVNKETYFKQANQRHSIDRNISRAFQEQFNSKVLPTGFFTIFIAQMEKRIRSLLDPMESAIRHLAQRVKGKVSRKSRKADFIKHLSHQMDKMMVGSMITSMKMHWEEDKMHVHNLDWNDCVIGLGEQPKYTTQEIKRIERKHLKKVHYGLFVSPQQHSTILRDSFPKPTVCVR